jgi:hypothetical protein
VLGRPPQQRRCGEPRALSGRCTDRTDKRSKRGAAGLDQPNESVADDLFAMDCCEAARVASEEIEVLRAFSTRGYAV